MLKASMAVIIRNLIGENWGWFSREDQRMHIQTLLNKKNKIHFWLETRGVRDFVYHTGKVSGSDTTKIKEYVDENRETLEYEWIKFISHNGWIKVSLHGNVVTLTVYPGTSGEFKRTIDLEEEFPGRFDGSLLDGVWMPTIEHVKIMADDALLAIGEEENLDHRDHMDLISLIFKDK
jgi:hypothetical protein